VGDLKVGGVILVSGAKDDASAADQGLGRGVGAGQSKQVAALLLGEGKGQGMGRWHGSSPA
jgi:hypothetical protein